MKLLIAEDDQRLLKSLIKIFEMNNYSVEGVTNGNDAYACAVGEDYDGIILDIMMPGLDGISVLKKIRNKGITTPVLFLTARTEVYQKIEGLDAGADDYLSKPFETAELLARVRAMLRRKDNFTPDIIEFNGVLLNRSTYEIIYKSNSQKLSGKEFQLLEKFMLNPKIIFTIEKLLVQIWGWENYVNVSVVWVHLSNIRKKLEKLNAPISIRFIRNSGYILEEEDGK